MPRSNYDKDEMNVKTMPWSTTVVNPAEAQVIQTLTTSGGDGIFMGCAIEWTGAAPLTLVVVVGGTMVYPLAIGDTDGKQVEVIGKVLYDKDAVVASAAAHAGTGSLSVAMLYTVQ